MALIALTVLAVLVLDWTLVSCVKDLALRAADVRLVPYASQLLDFVLSLFLFAGMVLTLGKLFGERRIDFFAQMIDALSRISRGDFSATIPIDSVGEPTPENQFRQIAININQMAESLQKMERMRQEFIANVSHEIQSPLTSIRGFAAALKEGGLSEETRQRYLSTIEAESRRLSRLSENLLRLSSLDAKTHVPVPKPYRLDSQLRSAVLAAEPQWTAKGIEFSADLEAVTLNADEDMMSQVWTNLVHNAVKFTPAGGKITASLRREDGRALVRFIDSGIGVSPEDLPFVFDRFYKADQARSRADDAAGSGLGLAISKSIVALHGGSIEASSDGLGRGCCFAVTLPSS